MNRIVSVWNASSRSQASPSGTEASYGMHERLGMRRITADVGCGLGGLERGPTEQSLKLNKAIETRLTGRLGRKWGSDI